MGHKGENPVAAHSFPGCVGPHHKYQHDYYHQEHTQHQRNDEHGQMDGFLVNLHCICRNVVIGNTGDKIPSGSRNRRIHKLIPGIPEINLGAAAFIVPEIPQHPVTVRPALVIRSKESCIFRIFLKICKQI